jgi:hypothetical protein
MRSSGALLITINRDSNLRWHSYSLRKRIKVAVNSSRGTWGMSFKLMIRISKILLVCNLHNSFYLLAKKA